MIYLPLLSWSCTYKAYSHLYSSTDVAFNVTIICTAMLSTTASSTIFFSWKTTASIIGQVKSYILDPWNYFCSMGTGISVRCEELLKGNGISGGTARVSWCERELLIGQNHILFYFIFSCLFKIQNNYYQRSHSWVLECKLNPYWSKLRLREKHDVMLFSFFT